MDRRALIGLMTLAAPMAAPMAVSLAAASPAAAAGGGGAGAPAASFIRLGVVTATTVRRDGRRGVMTVETGVDAPDPAVGSHVLQSAPRLRAAYNEVVGQAARELRPGAPPDVERMVRELQAATTAVLGRRGARILLGSVMVV